LARFFFIFGSVLLGINGKKNCKLLAKALRNIGKGTSGD
jgi:hypothetical protein